MPDPISTADPLGVLARLVEVGEGLVPADLIDTGRALVERAGQRRLIAPGVGVVALLGATGSGKSSLFNAICGAELAPVAVTRPTSTQPIAALPTAPPPAVDSAVGRLLDWLGVHERVRIPETPSWGPSAVGVGPSTVLLDLPDVDSDVTRHRAVAERLAGLVDVLVWVLDPEKYADAVIHHDFIEPMAEHAAVSVVAFNQVDRLSDRDREAATQDLTRLLAAEGMAGVDVIQVSARTGQGVPELRARIRAVADAEDVTHTRLCADARAWAALVRERIPQEGVDAPGPSADTSLEAVVQAAGRAIGVERIADAVGASMRLGAARRVGWLPARWVSRLRRDPLRAMHLGADVRGHRPAPDGPTPVVARTSLPAPDVAADAAMRVATEAYAASRTRQLPDAAREQATARLREGAKQLYDQLDAAVARTDLEQAASPRWWAVANAAQVLTTLMALVGGAWLAVLYLMDRYLLLPVDPPRWGHVPWPTILLLAGLLGGLALAAAGTALARVGAARRRARARERLQRAVAEVVSTSVETPLEQELARYAEVSGLLDTLCPPSR
ncbi:dGTPase [Actinomyces sp. 594]|uniref:GTPase family protein n=1 Tax=Actinomyces sp. 594 TaxID=2057793 RepID=UPI001C596099|nr:GTPase [Actinomyces sp. 594]MBW3070200.1 dGTPase [Actinomyces sp. 594]